MLGGQNASCGWRRGGDAGCPVHANGAVDAAAAMPRECRRPPQHGGAPVLPAAGGAQVSVSAKCPRTTYAGPAATI